MRITSLSIDKSITVFVLMIGVILMGISSYRSLPREASPDIKIPFVMVYAPYYGASPADLENLVTRKLEKELKNLNHLEEMSSTSSEGISTIVLEFQADVEMTDALQKVRDAVETAKPELPQDVREDLVVQEISAEDQPILQVVLSADYDPVSLKDVGKDLQEDLEQIRGVLGVDLTGGTDREVRIDVDPERLRFFGLGLIDVTDAIRFENVTLPGGELSFGRYEYQVRVPGEFRDVEEIGSILLNVASPNPVYLKDVAEVTFGLRDRDTISRKNQESSVTLSVKKRSGENIIRINDEVQAHIANTAFPEGTEVTLTGDQSEIVRDMVSELENNILSGLVLVVAVLFLFLGFTNSVFIGVAIPFSMLISFVVLGFMGVTLNMVVLFSLILALGMLVDNAIVIVENIFRHRTEGESLTEAAKSGTNEVSTAVIASSLTTIFAFAPMLFWPGIMGEFMSYLPLTLIVTLASSLLVALVFNPVLCSRFMRVPKKKPDGRPRFGERLMNVGIRSYEPILRWALRRRWWTLALSAFALIFIAVLFGKFNAGTELFPDVEPTYAYVKINAPSGTRIEVSDSYAKEVESEVAKLSDLKVFLAEVGASFDAFGGGQAAPPHLSVISMEFEKLEDRTLSSRDQLETLRDQLEDFTGATLLVEKMEDGPPTGMPVNVEIAGKDFAQLEEIAEKVKEIARGVDGIVNILDDYDRGRPEIQIHPDLEKAARYGLRRSDVASTVLTAIRGEEVTKYRVGEDEYEIMVRFAPESRRSIEDIEQLTVFYEGQNIPLTAFAEVSYEAGIGSITRLDSRRVITVTGDMAAGVNANAALKQVQDAVAEIDLPNGYDIRYTGENEDQEEASAFLGKAFGIALLLIFLVLVTQFSSVTVPFVIMISVILSLIGVFLGLMITRTPFGIIMTGVGVISLAGIVVNNAIVLLDYIIKLRARGLSKLEAVVEAGKTRFRPVVLTAVTTVLGLIPLTTGLSVDFNRLFHGDFARALIIGGESSQWWGPMGVAVIWGLVVATFLTLVIVPVCYYTIDPVVRALIAVPMGPFRLIKKRRSGRAPAGEAGV